MLGVFLNVNASLKPAPFFCIFFFCALDLRVSFTGLLALFLSSPTSSLWLLNTGHILDITYVIQSFVNIKKLVSAA